MEQGSLGSIEHRIGWPGGCFGIEQQCSLNFKQHIIITKSRNSQLRTTMKDIDTSRDTQPYFGYPTLPHFLSPFQNRHGFSWQSGPHYATPMLPLGSSFLSKLGSDMLALGKVINLNNQRIHSTSNMIEKMEQSLLEAEEEVTEKLSLMKKESKDQTDQIPFSELNQVPFFTNQPFITKIFNQEKFKFKLKLEHKFPKIIYKDRKLNAKVKLTNPDGTPICNANLIHLCIGACDQEGQWIRNERDELFMGGKIEVDLYHGQAQFKRIFPSDISRRYSSNNIKLIIYAKGSLLKFTGELQKHEKYVPPQQIEPLLICDVLVKAKKKL